MDLLKALKRTTILSAAAVLAFGATEARALDNTATLGHMSASIASALNVEELSPMRFGNFLAPGVGSTLVLASDGQLTGTGIVPLYGANATTPGMGTAANAQETASQAPGFFSIVTDTIADVYVTFSDNAGNIIDAMHPANNVILTGPGGPSDLTVDTFTFSQNTTASTGYAMTAPNVKGGTTNAPYGNYIIVTPAGDQFRVGATLHAAAGGEAAGRYTGTYYVMVSY